MVALSQLAGTRYCHQPEETSIKIYFDDHYVGAEHAFDTTRKARHIADALKNNAVDGSSLVEPASADLATAETHIQRVHTRTYVHALQTGSDPHLAASQGFDWDPGIWSMALHSTAGVIGATRSALSDGVAGSLSSGLHHAKPDSGDGFCTVNGLAIAVSAHLESHPDHRVAILDLDAHCGGGTAACLDASGTSERVQHLDLVTSPFDRYEPIGANDELRFSDNSDEVYLDNVQALLGMLRWDETDLVLYNAGMDPHPGVSVDALRERERLVFEAASQTNTPVAWVLAGGYTWGISMDALVNLHLLTITSAAERQPACQL